MADEEDSLVRVPRGIFDKLGFLNDTWRQHEKCLTKDPFFSYGIIEEVKGRHYKFDHVFGRTHLDSIDIIVSRDGSARLWPSYSTSYPSTIQAEKDMIKEVLRRARKCLGITEIEADPPVAKTLAKELPYGVLGDIKQFLGAPKPPSASKEERLENLRVREEEKAKASRVAASKLNPKASEFVPGRKGGRTRRRKHKRATRRVS